VNQNPSLAWRQKWPVLLLIGRYSYDATIMSRIIRSLVGVSALLIIASAWFWWNQPKRVDMAAYVPADALVYLEANSLTEIAAAMTDTDIWQHTGSQPATPVRQNRWLMDFVKITGIGSTASVLATRAQFAFVMFDLGAAGKGDTLEIKPVAAVVVETHTSTTRMKPVIEKLLDDFANRTYVHPRLERVNLSEGEFVRWISPDGQRRIVASFDGSVVVIGNDDQAVAACLAAHRGKRPSLLHSPDLEETRARLHADEALAFGYVSAESGARLATEAAPIALGKLFEGSQVQQLVATAAARMLGTVGWSSRSFHGGIEDSYVFGLKPGIATRLHSALAGTDKRTHGAWDFLPPDVYSATTYNLRDPATSWEALNVAVSSQLDTLSAVFFTTGFRSLLAPYGIDDPENFLRAIKPDVVTVRLTAHSDQTLVVAGIANAGALHQFVSKRFGAKPHTEKFGADEMVISPDERHAASFAGDFFILGAPEDLRVCLTARAGHATLAGTPTKFAAMTRNVDESNASSVVTFTNDADNARAFLASLAKLRGAGLTTQAKIKDDLPYAVTETAAGETGFERRSRSTFGLFGYLASLLAPEATVPAHP
jgi:hypothetical protein